MANQIIILLHWNLDYAEFPRSEANSVVKSSYLPMVEAVKESNLGKILMNITGHTIQYLKNNHPEIISTLVKLIENEKLELVASGFSHPIFPHLPKFRRLKQLMDHRDQIRRIFDFEPNGVWPPELAVSPIVLNEFREMGMNWTFVDHEHILISQEYYNEFDPFTKRKKTITEVLVEAYWSKWYQKPLKYYRAYKAAESLRESLRDPLITVTNMEKEINLVLSSVSWTNITVFALQNLWPFYTTSKLTKLIMKSKSSLIPLYCSDIEFFGYRSHIGNAPHPKKFVKFLKQLKEQGINIVSPSSSDEVDFNYSDYKITTGSWGPDKSLKLWSHSEDNREFARRLNEIYLKLNPENIPQEIENLLRIAENSDARGWSPINERKQEAYIAIEELNSLLLV